MNRFAFFLVLTTFSLCFSQMSILGTNRTEIQHGNLPSGTTGDQLNFYERLDLNSQYGDFDADFRVEMFESQRRDASYIHLAQRSLSWEKSGWTVQAGHFYTTLGRGLLLRAYELPGVIFEQRQFRRRYSYYRDIDGAMVRYRGKRLETQLFRGSVLDNTFPPELEGIDRRPNEITGGQFRLNAGQGLKAGIAAMQQKHVSGSKTLYHSLMAEWSLRSWLRKWGMKSTHIAFYAEHAQAGLSWESHYTQNKTGHATVASVTVAYKTLGLSAEYKDYKQFENRINLPPILYREHSQYLLNRVTHELLTDAEQGVQVELNWRPTLDLFLVANLSHAQNDFSYRSFEFFDRFVELNWQGHEKVYLKLFFDHSRDEVRGDQSRITAGMETEWQFLYPYALTLDMQNQSLETGFIPSMTQSYANQYMALSLSKSPRFTFSLAFDRSNNPVDVDDPSTPFRLETGAKTWVHGTASLRLQSAHQLDLFYGERRGGLICLSGTCFEVLPFKGLEFRYIVNF